MTRRQAVTTRPLPRSWQTGSLPNGRCLGRGLIGMWRQRLRALRAAPTTLPHLDDVATLRPVPGAKAIARGSRVIKRTLQIRNAGPALQGNDLVAPQARFQTRVSAHRRVAFESMSLDDVKLIKKTFGCTVNDVVMAICTTGLRTWLDERGELPAESLVGFIPVSVRTPEQMGTFGNRVSVMIAELPSETADPLERLRRINQSMNSAKDRHKALPASLMQDANHFIPPALPAQAARATSRLAGIRGIKQPVNVAISNVPGSPTPLYLGRVVQHAHFPISAVLDGIGLNITVVSYRESLEFRQPFAPEAGSPLTVVRVSLTDRSKHVEQRPRTVKNVEQQRAQ